jgi:hypothetical protein
MGGMATTPGRLVYRPVTGRVLTLCYVAFAVWWLVAGFSHGGRRGVSWTAVTWLVAVGAVMWTVLWRPAVVVDADGVLLLNVLRDIRVPWAALEAVETRYALTLVTAAHTYASWAAGAPGRSGAVARLGHGRGAGARVSEGVRDAEAAHLPRRGWVPGGLNPDRSSRDLRADSGAAAFMVEQAWVGWRERPGARVEAEAPVPPAGVHWNLPVVVGVPAVLALALLAGTVGV